MPLSSELADSMLARLDGRVQDEQAAWLAIKPLLQLQATWSALPSASYLLVEQWQSREGSHLFFYPFAGRHVHMGLATLLAWRLSKQMPRTFTVAVNDYGFELLCAQDLEANDVLGPELFDSDSLSSDILMSLNAAELSQRRFREIARVAGLVFQGYPGAKKTAKQIQASSGLFFEVFKQYDPDNQLLKQAYDEVLSHELEQSRLAQTLDRIQSMSLLIKKLERPTPFSFPLIVDRLRERLSSEQLSDRVARMVQQLERAIDG